MNEIDEFCKQNNISKSSTSDSYYFEIKGQKYRVSNHTIEASNSKAFGYDNLTGELIQKRELYHKNGRENDTIYITAGKTRLIEIYNNLKIGKKLNKRGYIIEEE